LPQPASIPGSDLVFDQPASWHVADPAEVLDPAWAIEQKREHPDDAALIDAAVDAVRSGDIAYSGWIDVDEDSPKIDGWIKAEVSQRAVGPGAGRGGARQRRSPTCPRSSGHDRHRGHPAWRTGGSTRLELRPLECRRDVGRHVRPGLLDG
jgi:hypothetical protein